MNYKKINKPTARKMYNCGFPIYLIPCKCRFVDPDSDDKFWITPVKISILDCEEEQNKFDRTVNAFEYYNCNVELGYYSAYYATEQDYDNYKIGGMCHVEEKCAN